MKKALSLFLFLVIAISISIYFFGHLALGSLARETEPIIINASNNPTNNNPTIGKFPDNDKNTEAIRVPSKNEDIIPVDVPIEGTEKYYKGVQVMEDIHDFLILVNKDYVINSDDKPSDLEKLPIFAPNRLEEVQYLRKDAATAIIEFCDAAQDEAELEILPASAYRSYELQTIIFSNNIERKGSVDKANETSALPGQSEHQTGLAVDVTCKEVTYQIRNAFENTDEAKWTAENAHRFGFIIRYPKDKKDITGYNYEPWHLRYVGKTVAQYIYENNITFEEYYHQFIKE